MVARLLKTLHLCVWKICLVSKNKRKHLGYNLAKVRKNWGISS